DTMSVDTTAVVARVTDDGIFRTPGGEPFGKDEFRARAHSLGSVEVDGRAEGREVAVAGDCAWMRNRLETRMTNAEGKTVTRAGWTLTVLKLCDDGRWRLFRDANLVT